MSRLMQGRLGFVSFTPTTTGASGVDTAILVPCTSWQLQARRNRVTGEGVGTSWSTNYADGMATSRFTANILCRKVAGEAFSAAFLGNFINRISIDGLDDTSAFTIVASDGAAAATLVGAKPESFQLSVQKGSAIGLAVTFVGPKHPTIAADRRGTAGAVTPATWEGYNKTLDSGKTLMFNNATFKKANAVSGLGTGTAVNELYGVTVNYSNNHIINAPLDGTLEAESFDAGQPKAGAQFTVKAHHGLTGDLAPLGTEQALRMIFNIGSAFNLDLAHIVPDSDLDSNANMGASFRTWECLVLGEGGGTPIPPLRIS